VIDLITHYHKINTRRVVMSRPHVKTVTRGTIVW